jgi:diguanylate cyclase (GGDEF)-like protein
MVGILGIHRRQPVGPGVAGNAVPFVSPPRRRVLRDLCDEDGLKAVNDTAGHLMGDSVLRSVAGTLRKTARTEDVVARFGGDEFVLLLPRTGLEAARALVLRLTDELPEQTYVWGGMPHSLPRVSLGIAAFPDDGLLADQLIAKADERMYADKARARGRLS